MLSGRNPLGRWGANTPAACRNRQVAIGDGAWTPLSEKEAGFLGGYRSASQPHLYRLEVDVKAKREQLCRICGSSVSKGDFISHVESMWVHSQCGRQLLDAQEAMARERDRIEETPRGRPSAAANAYRLRARRRDGRIT